MARCVTEVQRQFGQHVSAALSQPYYLDVTHPKANKGEVVSALSALLAIPTAQIATIGDMPNDVLMFRQQRGEHRHGQREPGRAARGHVPSAWTSPAGAPSFAGTPARPPHCCVACRVSCKRA